MERIKTQVELLKESCDIKDAACVRYQKRIAELEKENKKLREKIEKMEYGNSLAFDDIERICNEKLQLEEENKKLKETLEGISFVL